MSEMGEEPIAIVGLACRFPDATDVEAYWRLLCDGRDATREVPADRWNAGMWHDPDPHAPGRMITRHGCFLDDVSGFDPLFFGISPREAAEMDPQQRMILEVVWEALEDAGIPATSLKDSRTGVYMGAIWHDYAARHLVEHAVTTAHSATGQSLNIVANRISYFLGLRGPSLSVDTACSSSLVAVHLACQSLRSGESRLALVGGVNLMFSPETSVLLSRFGGLAPDGRSKAFAAGADGFGRGEGAGVVVLQPLSAAIASGAHIYCVIRGSVVNNNGTGNGLVAPSVPAQAALLRDAYAKAGVAPGRVHYVETHGTGTALGDPTEASALGAALGEGRPAERPLLIGSVKPNIGHLEGAAGIAGLLKLALSIDRRLMPPHLLLGEANPRIPFDELRLSLPRKLEPWPCEGESAIAGVSGFGWGGTNCHVVVEESPVGRGDLLPLAAEDEAELRAQVQRMEELALREESPVSLRDLCRTWATRVGTGRYRAAFTVNTRAELAVQVKAFQQGRRRAGLSVGEAGEQAPRVVFLCSPQGSQWPAMGRELLATEPVFRARLMAMDATFMPLAGWSLVEALREPNSRVASDEDAVHPLVLAVQVGLAALWRSWGVEPEVVVGHGVGDVAAACLAGVVEAGDAAWLVYRASRLDQWEALRDELEATQARLRPQARRAKWILTLVRESREGREGRPVETSARSRNTRQLARFNQAVEQLVEEGFDTFLELGPHPVLCRPVEQALRKAGRQGLVVGSLRREDARGGLLDALGAIHTRGVQVRWDVMPPPRMPVEEVPLARRPEALGRTELLPLSAQSHEALADSARALLAHLETSPHTLHDVAYTAAVHRAHLPHRLALVARSLGDVQSGLSAYLRGEPFPGLNATHRADGWRPPVVFVFPGQGSQWVGMGRKLLSQEPAFRVALEACDAALRRFVDWSLLDLLASDDAGWMERIDKVQPAIFSLQVALARLWRSWGVVPDVVVGHSMGEVAAAHVAGALTLEDAARIICRRSQLLRRLSGQGGMAMVELTLAEAREALRGMEDKLSVAASNSPRATVLSGEPNALSEVLERLEARHVFCRRVKVDVASHSPQMDPLREELLEALESLTPRRGEVPLYSTVTAALTDGADLDGAYWVRNLREPVLLAPVVEQLANSGHSLFLEVSPHPILLPSVEQTLAHLRLEGVVLPSLRREQAERDAMLETLGCLYSVGWEVQWPSLHPEGGRMLRLPDYPWQHQSYWFQPGAAGSAQTASTGRGHSLGAPRRSSLRPGAFLWDVELGPERLPYLKDHKVQGNAVLPATAYLDWGLAAAQEALGFGAWTLEGVRLSEVLVVPREGSRVAELVLAPGSSEGGLSFRVSSFVPSPGTAGSGVWTTHMTGNVRALGPTEAALSFVVSLEEVQRRCTEMLLGDVHYWEMEKRGLQYGPAFRGLQELWRREGEALGRISMPQVLGSVHGLHPAILDACLQVLLEAVPPGDGTFLPIQVRRYTVLRSDAEPKWAYARLTKQEPGREGATIEGDVLFFDGQGNVIGEVQGVTMKMLPSRTDPVRAEQDRVLFELTWRKLALPAPRGGIAGAPWLVLMDKGGQGEALAATLEARGEACIRVEPGKELRKLGPAHYVVEPGTREHLRQVLAESFPEGKPCSGVVFLWGLELPASDVPGAQALDGAVQACGSALRVVQEVVGLGWRDPPRLWVVTRGAWPVEGAAVTGALQASLWGLARSVGNEHPELRCTCVDLDPEAPLKDVEVLASELAANVDDEQVALRAGGRYGARLVRRVVSPELRGGEEPMMPAAGRPFRVETLSQSMLGVVLPRASERRRPGPGEVEIAVEASSLNFIDVMKAMGIYPGMPPGPAVLGLDCAGRISAVGPGVTGLTVGQAVVAFAPDALASHVVTDARFAVPLPSSVDMVDAGSLPSVFMTAWYALHHLGRLQKGERVLIHSAAGGLGLAAVQIAQAVGAEVFATAGTPEKREMLRGLGIQHVMDSRTLAFGDEVMRLTQGEGVDVVLNSLSGDAISRSLEVLAQDGRFLEVGKRDIYEGRTLDLSLFRRRLSYMAIDLVGLRERRPSLCAQLLREVVEQVGAGVLKPLPCRRFPISQVGEAIRTMAQGQHMGKLVVSMDDPELRLAPSRQGFRVRPDASYLITGGLGGLGLSAAKWLVEQGARCLLLMGRSEVPEATQAVLQSLRDAGARVEVVRADVADAKRLAEVVALTHGELPQLRGVLHCAGLLDDGIVEHQDAERFRKVMGPKVHGAWNLHSVTREESLDFFVLYSSMAALLGTPGQSNYAAANTALDALAHYRRQQGLPALSINWGPFSEVGLAAAQSNRGERLAFRGMGSFSPRQGEALLERLLSEAAINVAAVALDVRQWLEFFPSAATLRVWDELSAEQAGDAPRASRSGVLAELRQAAPAARLNLLESQLRERLAQVLRIEPSRVGRHEPFRALGLDSLLSLELRNRIEVALELKLSAALLWAHSTLAALATHLLEQVGLAPGSEAPTAEAQPPPPQPQQASVPEPQHLVVQKPAEKDVEQLASLSEEKLLELMDDALASLEDAS